MKVGKTLYVRTGRQWHAWLKKNHKTAKEIWLIYYRKSSGKLRIPYGEAIDEALCFGWIDSIVKNIDKDSYAHRWSPRKNGSPVSQLNKERIRQLIKSGRMTQTGLAAISHEMKNGRLSRLKLPKDIENALKSDPEVWKHFKAFPPAYKRIRISWIESARGRPQFRQRLDYFIRKTKSNKRFGMVR